MTITTQKSQESRLDRLSVRFRKFFDWLFTVRKVGLALLILSVSVGMYGQLRVHGTLNFSELVEEFYANVSSELGSVAITVLIIDSLYQRRQLEQEKQRLIRQMSSTENGLALQAVEELRALGSIKDGSLVFADLEEANLENARLGRADMRQARMDFSNLSEAKLYFANLEKADMSGVNLQKAVLSGANLREVDLVAADLRGALLSEADLTDAKLTNTRFDLETLLPDGKRWSTTTDLGRFTDPQHSDYWRSSLAESPAYINRKRRGS